MEKDLEWPTREDARWWMGVLLAAARRGVPVQEVQDGREAALAAVIDSGTSAEELFGIPEKHARSMAADVPAGGHAAGDSESVADVATGTLLVVGLLGLGAIPVILFDSGWSVPLTPNGLGIVAVLVLGMSLALGVHRWWRNGRLRAATMGGVLGFVGLFGGVAASMSLPGHDRVLAQIPTAGVAVVALGSLWWGARRSNRRAAPAPTDVDAPTWFSRLSGLLRGRHHLSAQTTRDVVAQARQHVAASGAQHPSEEFGTPETYARIIAAQTEESAVRGARARWFTHLGLVVILGYLVVTQVAGGSMGWAAWIGVVAIVTVVCDLIIGRRDVGAAR